MKKFSITAAQGEISLRRLGDVGKVKIPAGSDLASEGGKIIVGHSETGHHHVLERPAKVTVAKSAPAGMRILYAILEEPNALIHERSFDTHEPINLPAGVYEFRIGREFDPYAELARRQAD
jgi:hypothetical protein